MTVECFSAPYFQTYSLPHMLSDQNNRAFFAVYISQVIPALYQPHIGSNRLRLTIQVSVPPGTVSLTTKNFLSKPVKYFKVIDGLHSHHDRMEAVIDPVV